MSTTTAVKESEVEQIDHVLGGDTSTCRCRPARRSLFSVAMVWIGFPMIITGAMTDRCWCSGWAFSAR